MRSKLNFFLFKDWSGSCALPAFLARIAVGYFFLVSGLGKLFIASRHMGLLDTLTNAGIPFPEFNVYFVPIIEAVFGAFLLLGFLTLISSLTLFLNMLVAIFTVAIQSIHASGFWLWLDDFIYLPEVLLVLLLFWLMFAGAGKCSVDHLIGGSRADT